MLDWSQSPLVAAFFATTHRPQPGPAAFWALAPSHLNSATLGRHVICTARSPDVTMAASKAWVSESGPLAVACELPEIDQRHFVQQGRFTIHGTHDALDLAANAAGYLRKFIIPADRKEGLALDLAYLGIQLSSLFPDLDRLAEQIAGTKYHVRR